MSANWSKKAWVFFNSVYPNRNVEPLAQTWIRCECLYSNGHNGLTSPKRIQSSRALRGVGYEPEARAGLNRSTFGYLLPDAKSFSEIFADSVIGSYFRIVGKRFKLIHIGQPLFAKYVFIGLDA